MPVIDLCERVGYHGKFKLLLDSVVIEVHKSKQTVRTEYRDCARNLECDDDLQVFIMIEQIRYQYFQNKYKR